jgi:hypothetical protein
VKGKNMEWASREEMWAQEKDSWWAKIGKRILLLILKFDSRRF